MGFEVVIAHDNAGQLKEGEAADLGRQISASDLPRDRFEIKHSGSACPELLKLIAKLSQSQRGSNKKN